MGDLTQNAVATLLNVLTTTIKNEAKLRKGVKSDIQFIIDEMDSMNGFLLHLTKSGNEHDDQQRAWMKQVREVAYLAQDCIELYTLYGQWPPCKGVGDAVCFAPSCVSGQRELHRLDEKIKELKERVKEVGGRRERYGVTVPPREAKRRSDAGGNSGDDKVWRKEREEFLQALQDDEEARASAGKKDEAAAGLSLPSMATLKKWIPRRAPYEDAIRKLSNELAPHARKICGALLKYKDDVVPASKKQDEDGAIAVCMGMVLRALHAFPKSRVGNEEELKKLINGLDSSSTVDLPKRVMTFCYSELTKEEKICLQYLAAFRLETSIRRTSLVRRCVAERLVGDDKERELTMEQRTELCFDELLFRGFISRDAIGAVGKVKSCRFSSDSVRQFIEEMCKAENFVGGGLPVHLRTQIEIRAAALEQQHAKQKMQQRERDHEQLPCSCICVPVVAVMAACDKTPKDPIDNMLGELHLLPKTYRLNVMDLGGCKGILKWRHLKSICQILTLKYLSFRNTDVVWLPREVQELRLLETLDIRQSGIPYGSQHRAVRLPSSLKYLLAGNVKSQGDAPSVTVGMPDNVKGMINLEIMAHVTVSRRRELRKVENLTKLRKLGVVFVPSQLADEDGMMKDLIRAIGRLSGCLHSLSVRTERAPFNGWPTDLDGGLSSSPVPSNLVSLRIDGMRSFGLPAWVVRLSKLEKITLCNTLLTDEKLDALSELPGLVCLRLRHRSYTGRELTFRKQGGFPSLRFLRIEGVLITTELRFLAGTAPELEKIVWSADYATDEALVAAIIVSVTGIVNLPKLREVVLKGLRVQNPAIFDKEREKHPNRPRLITLAY